MERIEVFQAPGGYFYRSALLEGTLVDTGWSEAVEAGKGVWSKTKPSEIPDAQQDDTHAALLCDLGGASERAVNLHVVALLVRKGRGIEALSDRFKAEGLSSVAARARAFRGFPEARRVFMAAHMARQTAERKARP